MKSDIILGGVGGQGILSIATIIGQAALESGINLKQAEVHGMSQRGGDVQSHLRLSDKEIFSDLIPFNGADIILSVEPMESLRYLPYLSKTGWLITNKTSYNNISDYPEMTDVLETINKIENHIVIDADAIAKEVGSPRSMNMVMAGVASVFIDIDFESLKNAIRTIFGSKGDKIVDTNIKALEEGRKFAEENKK